MHRILFSRIVALLLIWLPAQGFAGSFYLGGIQVNEPDPVKWVQTLKGARMNTIAVTVYSYQGDWDSDQLSFKRNNVGLEREVRAAKAEGLKVVLILRTALDHAYPKNKFLWHGLIMPKSDDMLNRWFEKYTAFVSHWSRFARQEGVDLLGIGSEMNSLTATVSVDKIPDLHDWYLDRLKQEKMKGRLLKQNQTITERHLWVRGHKNYATFETYLDDKQLAHERWARQTAFFDAENPVVRINERRRKLDRLWRTLIRHTRGIYHGPLTYAANFDQYHEVGFWDALDLMGINAYFPLRKNILENNEENRLKDVLAEGWSRVFNRIDDFIGRQGLTDLPIIFTELGYTRRKNSTLAPWAGTGFSMIGPSSRKKLVVWQDQAEDAKERALAIEALYETTRNRVRNPLTGILYWKLSTLPSHKDIEPFVSIVGSRPKDPLIDSLQLFR
jgi:Glycoside Hydrolase Family 113